MLINKLKKVLVCTILICLIFPYFYINITYAYPVDSEGNPIDQTEQLPSEIEEVIDPDDEYTKYSFPSKTFEYMVSGTPMISTDLEGIPDEYKKYMFMVDYSDEKIVDKIYEILNLDDTFLEEFGKKAREFVLNEKNPCVQVKKINKFLNFYI